MGKPRNYPYVSTPELAVMAYLRDAPEPVTLLQLRDALGLGSQTLSYALGGLQSQGLVRSKPLTKKFPRTFGYEVVRGQERGAATHKKLIKGSKPRDSGKIQMGILVTPWLFSLIRDEAFKAKVSLSSHCEELLMAATCIDGE